VKVNGRSQQINVQSNGYVALNQKWKNGDVIEIKMPAHLRAETLPDNPSRQAFFYGPVLLAGNLGPSEPDPLKGISAIVNEHVEADKLLTKDPSSLSFHTSNNIQFQPFYSIADDHYSVYWDVFTPSQWKEQQMVYESRKKLEYEREQGTVDVLRIGEMQPERDHELTGEKTEVGESHTHKYRIAEPGGYFSFTMKVVPDFSYLLVASYWGMDNRGRQFDVLVDGEKIASEDLNKYKESKFYDITYRIPTTLTNGKTKITIKFQPKEKNSAGPVYGVRLVKESIVNK
jgi:hypothetical protein